MREIKVTSLEPKDALNIAHRKEHGFDRAYIVIDKKGDTIAELRTYWPANDCYACLWIHYGGIYASGSGRAGGYGYDKRSAAVSNALGKAGVTLNVSINGTGCEEEAMEALGHKLAGRQFLTVIKTNG